MKWFAPWCGGLDYPGLSWPMVDYAGLLLLLLLLLLEFRSALCRQRSRDSPVETAGVRLELHSSQGTNGNSNKFNTVVLWLLFPEDCTPLTLKTKAVNLTKTEAWAQRCEQMLGVAAHSDAERLKHSVETAVSLSVYVEAAGKSQSTTFARAGSPSLDQSLRMFTYCHSAVRLELQGEGSE